MSEPSSPGRHTTAAASPQALAADLPVRSWSERLAGHGLQLNVHRHAPEGDVAVRATIVMLHGFLDAGATFAPVARALAARRYHVLAPDQRGFGHSDRVSGGGYYHFPNYLADVDALVRAIAPERLILIGHSMGGTVASMYAGARPKRVAGLALLEGLGPPAMAPELAVTRTRSWLDQLAHPKPLRPPKDRADALRRLSLHHARVSQDKLREHVELLTREQDGALAWTYDPLHRTTAPVPFYLDAFKAFLNQISCPVLIAGGGPSGWQPADIEERIAALPTPPQRVDLDDAGHMLHWTRPTELARVLGTFADEVCAREESPPSSPPADDTSNTD